MIVGVGIDIAPVARFERALRDPADSFRGALFTSAAAEAIHIALTHSERLAAAILMIEGAASREVQE